MTFIVTGILNAKKHSFHQNGCQFYTGDHPSTQTPSNKEVSWKGKAFNLDTIPLWLILFASGTCLQKLDEQLTLPNAIWTLPKIYSIFLNGRRRLMTYRKLVRTPTSLSCFHLLSSS